MLPLAAGTLVAGSLQILALPHYLFSLSRILLVTFCVSVFHTIPEVKTKFICTSLPLNVPVLQSLYGVLFS